MSKLTKNQKVALSKIEAGKAYSLAEAVEKVKEVTYTKFDASLDIDVRLGVDPRKANQMVRGVVTLPHGTGKQVRVLGPRGLMPNPKSGTVTTDVAKAVEEVKKGKIDFKVDKNGIVHSSIGKVSFTPEQMRDNAREFIATLIKLKPATAKGTYIKSIYLSSTMSLGVKVDTKSVEA